MRVNGGRPLNSAGSCQLITTEVEWEEHTANYFIGCFDMFAHTHYAMVPGGGGWVGGVCSVWRWRGAFWQVMLFEYLFFASVAQGK